jgi:RNA-directed DNA polymerase
MAGKQQKIPFTPALPGFETGEALSGLWEGTEPVVAKQSDKSPAPISVNMEEICESENMKQALKRVKSNRGSAGIDGMSVKQLSGYLKHNWESIRRSLLSGDYQPMPVKRVYIDKPDGGKRGLGIPSVIDRLIQQAIAQRLQHYWDGSFSRNSYGFRPGKSAHQAVFKAQGYQEEGCRWVVDLDLEKFFDRVNHDRLMSILAGRIADKRLLRLIRSFLEAGIMENGLVSFAEEGAPQGGPLSPFLSNVFLDELDKILERRGHKFVRYADDCNIYVKSRRAGERIKMSITRILTDRMKLRVNEEKSAVARPWERKFLGFSFTWEPKPRRRISPKAIIRFKNRIRELTSRTCAKSLEAVVDRLKPYILGWRGYFGFCETRSVLLSLDEWIRRRLRNLQWKQWKRGKRKFSELTRLGVSQELSANTAGSGKGPWRISKSPAMHWALNIAFFDSMSLPKLIGA